MLPVSYEVVYLDRLKSGAVRLPDSLGACLGLLEASRACQKTHRTELSLYRSPSHSMAVGGEGHSCREEANPTQ